MKNPIILLVVSLILTISCSRNDNASGTISVKIVNQDGESPNCSFDGYIRAESDSKDLTDFFMYFDYVPGTNVENRQANNFTFEKVAPGTYNFEIESSCVAKTFTVDYEGGNYSADFVIEDCPEEPALFMAGVFGTHLKQ